MKNSSKDFGVFALLGLVVLAVAFLTGCSSGDNGSSRGNGTDNDEGPPAEGGGDPPSNGPSKELPDQLPE